MRYTRYIRLALVVGMVGLVLMMGSGLYYIYSLEEQIDERDRLIEELAFSDSLVKEYFDIERDSLNNVTYYTLKQSKQKERIVYANDEKKFYAGNDVLTSSEIIERYNSLIEEEAYLVGDYNELVKKYNSLIEEKSYLRDDYNELAKKYNKTYSYSKALEAALNLINRAYEIGYDIKMDSMEYKITLLPSPKIDSALILLPYFRDHLEHDRDAGVWLITRKIPKK